MTKAASSMRAILLTFVIVSLWINASEIFRYFVFVMPMTRQTLAMVPDVAPMNLSVFLVWGLWDTLLVVMSVVLTWLYVRVFGASFRSAMIRGDAELALLLRTVLDRHAEHESRGARDGSDRTTARLDRARGRQHPGQPISPNTARGHGSLLAY